MTLFSFLVFSTLIFHVHPQTTLYIDPTISYQTIEGWGVSLAWWANIAGAWPDSLIKEIASKATNDLNMNVFRFNIGGGENPNCPYGDHMTPDGRKMPGYRAFQKDQQGWGTYDLSQDARQIKVMDQLAALRSDVITEVFSNSPPWWMTKSKCAAGNVFGAENIDPNYFDDFADYLATVASALSKRNPKWNIQYIEPFNEPTSSWWKAGNSQEGSYISKDSQAKILGFLSNSQETYQIGNVKRTAPDSNEVKEAQNNIWYLWNYHRDQYNGLSKINTHTYGGSWQDKQSLHTDAVNGGKTLWQSETGPLSWSPSDGKSWWQVHYMMAYRQIEDLRNLQSTVWVDWQLLSKDYGAGWGFFQWEFDEKDPFKVPVLTETKEFYCRKQVNGFIKKGFKMIDISDGVAIAAISPDKRQAVIVITNQDSNDKTYDIDLTKFSSVGTFRTYRTSGDESSDERCKELVNNAINGKGVMTKNKVISYMAPKYSVTTFVVAVA